MRWYSDFPGRRAAEIVGDVLAAAVLAGGVALALALHTAIVSLEAIGGKMQQSGSDLASTMTSVGQNLAGIPLIGDAVRAPFDSASAAGGTLADAGSQWQSRVHLIAGLAGWTVVALVVLIVALGWVRPRVRDAVRRASLARLAASAASLDLLALRALTTLPIRGVLEAGVDAAEGWRRGDPTTIGRLAALELRRAGVRLDTP
ncbi:hypothetical protein GCM10011512_10440 [Tersicoccus solisilvae]|uniref:Transmembrane protein n=1 Tax=Tersicoccus solisilvae TaxID=1882339 RepID=A0ABQ1NXQ3_9MICC|nr:hypothetical protein [Tersicoccus solisilvae]GGC85507.1 hypothetical protein GCM10011512_10440 [Tersicoccus solisilvae]